MINMVAEGAASIIFSEDWKLSSDKKQAFRKDSFRIKENREVVKTSEWVTVDAFMVSTDYKNISGLLTAAQAVFVSREKTVYKNKETGEIITSKTVYLIRRMDSEIDHQAYISLDDLIERIKCARKTARIINLTPHAVNICNTSGEVVQTFNPEGLVRLKAITLAAGEIAGITITKTQFGQPEGLPGFMVGRYYIVSQLVKSALPQRTDLLVPAEVVRDSDGIIIGCKSLGK